MKRVSMLLMCLFALLLANQSAKAQDVTITLIPGWTWISYPKAEVMDIATALGDFVPMEGDIIQSQYANTTYRNGQWRGRLQQFTPGLGYMYYSTRVAPATLVFGGSTPQAQVQVTTDIPVFITAVSAMCGGNVVSNDGTYIIVKGICWATHETPTSNDNYLEEGSGEGSFSATMTGLNWSTTYYVRAYAVTPSGTVYGEQQSFTTRDGIPTLTTDSITSITAISATSGGNITDDGGLSVTARGVCWSTSPNPTVNDSHTTDGTGTGGFIGSITDLEISTTYYVRAYATTNAGTGYGEQVSFTTRDGIPTVTTAEATNIGSSWAICGGNVSDDGGLCVIERGVCWSTIQNPTLSDSCTSIGTGVGDYSTTIYDFESNNIYYVRAYATNNHFTVYGNEISFTTEIEHTWMNGTLPNAFSISSTERVYFSQGNLQYQPLSNTWKFAENQYEICDIGNECQYFIGNGDYDDYYDYILVSIEDYNAYIQQGGSDYYINYTVSEQYTASYTGWIDLFGWGTSGYNHGAASYQPWSISTYDSDYYAYGNPQNHLYDQTGQADWGYNLISNGGNQPNLWRTLTNDEWGYVFDVRSTVSGIRYAKALVNSVNGVILLPDDWSSSVYSLNNTNSRSASFNSNILTASQWKVLEQSGAVFLPVAGYRVGTSVTSVSRAGYGYYWSASCGDVGYPHVVGVYNSNLLPQRAVSGSTGVSVRLVRPFEN